MLSVKSCVPFCTTAAVWDEPGSFLQLVRSCSWSSLLFSRQSNRRTLVKPCVPSAWPFCFRLQWNTDCKSRYVWDKNTENSSGLYPALSCNRKEEWWSYSHIRVKVASGCSGEAVRLEVHYGLLNTIKDPGAISEFSRIMVPVLVLYCGKGSSAFLF